MRVRPFFRFIARIIGGVLLVPTLYVVAALVGAYLEKSGNLTPSPSRVFYVKADAFHTDIILPAKDDVIDWSVYAPYSYFSHADTSYGYIAFSWGDRRFLKEVPTLSDFRIAPAASALLLPTPSAVQAYYTRRPTGWYEGARFFRIGVSDAQYRAMIHYIRAAYHLTPDGKPIAMPLPYASRYAYFLSDQSYHAFHTCNHWITEALRCAELPTPLWSPSGIGLVHHLARHWEEIL